MSKFEKYKNWLFIIDVRMWDYCSKNENCPGSDLSTQINRLINWQYIVVRKYQGYETQHSIR